MKSVTVPLYYLHGFTNIKLLNSQYTKIHNVCIAVKFCGRVKEMLDSQALGITRETCGLCTVN